MNAIEQIFGAAPTNPAAAAPAKEMGQEDFLKLLVAQLENQDPNNPADNGEFLSQIAQFSMVSGIDELGVSFDGIAGSLYNSQAMQAAQLVGKEALIETSFGRLEANDNIEGFIDLEEDAAAVKLQIRDASGSLVSSVDLGEINAGMRKFKWDGLDDQGNPSALGDYTITVEGLVEGELAAIPVHIFNSVESVSVDKANTNVQLHLANDSSVNFSQVREYR